MPYKPAGPRPYRFVGGPLDGFTYNRGTLPGRWSTYLNDQGEHVPTVRIEGYRDKGCNCRAFLLYMLSDVEDDPRVYRWLDEHDPHNHR